jgi:hypothetical protein
MVFARKHAGVPNRLIRIPPIAGPRIRPTEITAVCKLAALVRRLAGTITRTKPRRMGASKVVITPSRRINPYRVAVPGSECVVTAQKMAVSKIFMK